MAARISGFSAPAWGEKAGSPSRHSETCRCTELPDRPWNGFAMNVARAPAAQARARTAYFRRKPSSAAPSGSLCRMLISS